MNYPVWDLPFLGSGIVVAIIAVIHVLISHFAVGGGAFLFVAEWWSGNDPDGDRIRAWLHKFLTFFLVFTTVFGAITGVGIWFSIQLASPEATSLLIHQFVFAWAAEWVVFLAELTILYFYYYGWKANSRRMQVFLSGAYFVISWFSLFIIVGILGFMLTPGNWTLENPSVYEGFFNPTYWPMLFGRTLIMFLLAGLGGLVIASRIEHEAFKTRIVHFCVKWVIPAAFLIPIFAYWYWTALPENTVKLVTGGVTGVMGGKMESITTYAILLSVSGAVIMLSALLLAIRPQALTRAAAVALLLVALLGIMGGEFFREMARKPYVVYGYLYSNSLWKHKADEPGYLAKPYFEASRWDPPVEALSPQHGEWLFRLQCANCHTLNGYRSLTTRTVNWSGEFGYSWLDQTMPTQGVMPPFQGSREDKAALSAYLISLQSEGEKQTASEILAVLKAKEVAKLEKEAAVPSPAVANDPVPAKESPENQPDVQPTGEGVLP